MAFYRLRLWSFSFHLHHGTITVFTVALTLQSKSTPPTETNAKSMTCLLLLSAALHAWLHYGATDSNKNQF